MIAPFLASSWRLNSRGNRRMLVSKLFLSVSVLAFGLAVSVRDARDALGGRIHAPCLLNLSFPTRRRSDCDAVPSAPRPELPKISGWGPVLRRLHSVRLASGAACSAWRQV